MNSAIEEAKKFKGSTIEKEGTKIWGHEESLGGTIEEPNRESNNSKFPDVANFSWYYDSVTNMANKGHVKGLPDGTFKPQGTISNAEFITILMRTMTGEQLENKDPNKHWAESAISKARETRVIGDLRVEEYNQPISRLEMARYLETAMLNLSGERVPSDELKSHARSKIPDLGTISGSRDRTYVTSLYARGMLIGNDSGAFNQSNSLTRAEALVLCQEKGHLKHNKS